MKITLLILGWLIVVIGGNLAWHIIGIVKYKSKPNYPLTSTLRGMAMVAFGILCTWYLDEPMELPYFYPIIGFCLTTYLIIYNPSMNYLKNRFADAVKVGYWYLGKMSGPLDRFFARNLWLYKTAYFIAIPLLIYCVYLMYKRY